jgi:hypothetical protein
MVLIHTAEMSNEKLALSDVADRLVEWRRSFRLWRALNNGLRIISLTFSFTLAIGLKFIASVTVLQLLAWTAFLTTLILLWLQPAKRAKAYADAWRGLDDIYSRYLVDEDIAPDNVYDVRLKGEQLISFTDPG